MFNYVPIKHEQMSFVLNGGKFKLYTVLNGLIFSTPTHLFWLFGNILLLLWSLMGKKLVSLISASSFYHSKKNKISLFEGFDCYPIYFCSIEIIFLKQKNSLYFVLSFCSSSSARINF
ncbi:unnamed protein product [Tenebrio molitor]|nr:unnamed protein product [Tenebrio molitor]